MKSLYLLVLALAVSVTSCRTKEGEPGPAGATNLMQQGSISGTITYTNSDGNDAQAPFSYTYYESLNDNKFYYDESDAPDLYYELSFKRRDLKDNNNYFNVQCYGYGTNEAEDEPEYTNIDFSFVTVVDGELLEFNGYSGMITNVNLNPTTGRLTFDYTNPSIELGNGTATLTAKVDVILNRSASYVVNID